MKSTSARGATLAILLASLTSTAWCQDAGLPNLLSIPSPNDADNARASATDALWGQPDPSPAPQVGDLNINIPMPSVIGSDYTDAMKSGYDGGPTTCGSAGCGHNHYIYANALIMTSVKQGGFVAATDTATGNSALAFDNSGFNNIWHGGMEIGSGWCFGCNCNSGIEVVYWGLWPGTSTATARGNLNSTLDFSGLDYNGAAATPLFQNAMLQQVQYGFNFNSVEVNLVGNSLGGGPFGCGMCGCCNGRGGSPWGFGWVGGFRYINFSEQFLYRSDTADGFFNGDPNEINYRMSLNNNLFGFQLGGGLSYCVTNRLTAYTIAKFGIYDNRVTQFQTVYGTQGAAVVNSGTFAGQDFVVRSTDNVFSTAGQFDLGGRWAINDNWSVNFGYRVLGLSGVAITEVNAVRSNFQNVSNIANQQTTGSFILHGGYIGATYCW